MSIVNRIARRRFLLAAGGVTIALPFLPSIMGESRAAAGTRPKRFIHIFTSNGQRPQNWYPTTQQAWKVLSATGSNYAREAPLAGPDAISAVLGTEFAPLKSKLLLVRGLDFIQRRGKGHEPSCTLGGILEKRNVTVDQILAYSTKVYPSVPPLGAPRSIHMLMKDQSQAATSVSTTKEGVAIDHQTKPSATFDILFKSLDDANMADAQLEQKRQALKLRIVDQVKGQFDQLHTSPKLGVTDKQRLEAHMSYLDDLEARLMATGGAVTCTKPTRPADPDAAKPENLPALTTMNIDLLVAAILCDRTRVATLMLCPGTDLRSFVYLPGGPLGEHHGISHDVYEPAKTVADGKLAKINNWYAKQVADLLTKLDVVEDPMTGATYLDNSIVFWGNEDGCNNGDAHEHMGMPALLAGSAGGYFKTGRYLDYRHIDGMGAQEKGARVLYPYSGQPTEVPDTRELKGRPYNSLLISLMQSMGLAPEDYETAGQPGFGDYTDNYQDQYAVADGQKPLPFT
jgi:Protein of unknown function (DUF1552)